MRIAIKRDLFAALLCLLIFNASFVFAQKGARANPQASGVERKINNLLAQMTLAEKLGQLQQLDGEADGRFRPNISNWRAKACSVLL
jgi:hypothetical protein